MSFTSATLSTAVWKAQGNPGKTCVSQANAIDVGAGLDANQFPNRTQWAQAALLWNLVQTQNTTDTSKLQKFAINAPWSSLGTSDGPTTQSQSQFTTTASGFVFNFAAQTATPVPATFIVTGQPTQAQIGRVNDIANTTLNRMYTFAQGRCH